MENLNIDDSSNLAGMSLLIDTSNANPSFNPQELEQQIINAPRANSQYRAPRPVSTQSIVKDFNRDLDRLTNTYTSRSGDTTSSDIDALLRSIDDDDSGSRAFHGATSGGMSPVPTSHTKGVSFFDSGSSPVSTSRRHPGVIDFEDQEFADMTNEQVRQGVIGNVIDTIQEERGGDSAPIFSIEHEKQEDEKARKLEHIFSLRETLADEGQDLSRIPNVTHNNSLEEIDIVLRQLVLKNDRIQCHSLAEDTIMIGAHLVEWIADGKRSYFGYTPDMTDWSKSVQSKLRRMRHDTSTIVSNIIQKHKIGPVTRVLLELLPNMVLYSRMRKQQYRDNIVSDDEFNAGINQMRNYETAS